MKRTSVRKIVEPSSTSASATAWFALIFASSTAAPASANAHNSVTTTANPTTICARVREIARAAGPTRSLTSSITRVRSVIGADSTESGAAACRPCASRGGRAFAAPRTPTLEIVTIAPLPTGLGVRTRLVDDPVRLLDLLPDREGALAWVHGGEGLVGWGEVARLATAGPARFRDADRWWRSFAGRLAVDDEVGLPGTGPVAFTSFTFADDARGSVLDRAARGGRPPRRRGVDHRVLARRRGARRPAGAPVRAPCATPTGSCRWRATGAAVAEAVRRMRAGELDKVVLAHDLLAVADGPLDARHLLAGLAAALPGVLVVRRWTGWSAPRPSC